MRGAGRYVGGAAAARAAGTTDAVRRSKGSAAPRRPRARPHRPCRTSMSEASSPTSDARRVTEKSIRVWVEKSLSMDTTTKLRELVVVSAQIPAATKAELERRAHHADRSLSAEIRRALARYLRA